MESYTLSPTRGRGAKGVIQKIPTSLAPARALCGGVEITIEITLSANNFVFLVRLSMRIQNILLKWNHTSRSKQQRRIIPRHQRRRGYNLMSILRKVVEKAAADIIHTRHEAVLCLAVSHTDKFTLYSYAATPQAPFADVYGVLPRTTYEV